MNNALQLFGNYWDHWNENKIFIPSGDRTQDLWIRKLGLGQNFEVRVGTFTKHDSQEPWTVVSKGHQARSTMHKKDLKKSQSLFTMHSSLFSSVVEHWSRKPGVVSSNLTGGIILNLNFNSHEQAFSVNEFNENIKDVHENWSILETISL